MNPETLSPENRHGRNAKGSENHDISTSLHYTKASTNGSAGPMIWGHTAFEADCEELVPVTVRNIRGKETLFSLDRNGFQIVKHKTSLTLRNFNNGPLVKGKYYAEIEDVLKRITGASLVKITHHVLRRSRVANPDSLRMTRPITQVHVDSNDDRIRYTVKAIYPQDYDSLLEKRYAMINVWRPLKKCYRDPLGFCDGSTVRESSYVPREIVMPGTAQRQVNTGVTKDEGHAWYYLHEQEVDEIILLKCWDSKDGVVRRCPHSSIPNSAPTEHEDRESIELRCLLFWQD